MTDAGIDWKERNRQHALGIAEFQKVETIQAGVHRALVLDHPLDRYLANESIDSRQYDAGFKLYHDYILSMMSPSLPSYDGTPAPVTYFSRSVTDRQLTARDAYTKALLAVGQRLSLSLEDIILQEMTLEQHARRLKRSERTAKRRFKKALDGLADYYKLR